MTKETKDIKSFDQLIGCSLQITIKPWEKHYTKRVLTGICTAADVALTILLENTQEYIVYDEYPEKIINRNIGMISVPYDTIEKVEMKLYEYNKV